ncbi:MULTISPECIES: TonB-dependent receptor [Pseudoalteromonas]|uniref:TonB-dependent receptor n=1 Tax=Pseudoalteromonas TaxID=53246 RepID=UPI000FFE4C76|nr:MULTISPECIES: TonB-dependent receptor [Pseudoalteromonas]MCG9761731.1 TonB-dependent receptor [Pseudoalteromonas sp. Isolate6]NKC19094.1 TonB-dependent receptor [Pseudoalteromonas galatheae]RXE89256.1 TonB-dependent receptor [Pseudoalteromonas sp. A757]
MLANNFKKSLLAVNVSIALGAGFSGVVAAEESQNQVQENVEVIEVRGIRRSLEASMNTKRFANSVVDAVTAEDIGDFPDKNIADSLQRISGVQISKDFGEGSQVSIRGTDPDLTKTQLNGQSVASTGWYVLDPARRSFNFELMPSEMVSGLEVYKTPQAKLDEGGVGGTIIMRTRKPLDLESNSFFGSVEAQYSELSESTDPAFSGLASWKNEDETFGILGAISSAERHTVRHQGENYWTWGNGVAHFDQERERTAYDITAQWAPNDSLDMVAHYFTTELKANNQNSNYLIMPGRSGADLEVTATNDDLPVKGIHRTDGATDYDAVIDAYYREATMETEVLDFTVNYETDAYTLTVQFGKTEATGGTDKEVGAQWGGYSDAEFEITSKGLGHRWLNLDGTDASALKLANDEFMAPSFSRSPKYDEEAYLQADIKYHLDSGDFTSIEAGFKVRDHETGQKKIASNFTNQSAFDNKTVADFNGGLTESMLPESGPDATVDKFLKPDHAKLLNFMYSDAGVSEFEDRTGYSKLEEDHLAFYVQGNFSGENYRGNIGLRHVSTDLTAIAYDPSLTKLVEHESEYSDWLPSVNIAYNLSEDVILRAAAAKVLARPKYTDLSPAYSGSNPTLQLVNQGNPELDPFRASQFDFGAEWYFNESSMLSVTFFSKSLESFVLPATVEKFVPDADNPGIWTVTTQENGGNGNVEGIEVQYQQDFGNGFGIVTNYTYSDASGEDKDGKKADLVGNSRNTFNISGYFENDLIAARLAYNWRDEFFNGSTFGTPDVASSRGYLDASIVYHVTENIDVSFEAVNLLNEVEHTTAGITNNTKFNAENGRRYFVGASFRF